MRHLIVLLIGFHLGAVTKDALKTDDPQPWGYENSGDYSYDYDCSELSEYTGEDECAQYD